MSNSFLICNVANNTARSAIIVGAASLIAGNVTLSTAMVIGSTYALVDEVTSRVFTELLPNHSNFRSCAHIATNVSYHIRSQSISGFVPERI